jgi:hypothetical protein
MKISKINLVNRCTGCRTHYTIGETGDESMCDPCIADTKSYEGDFYDSDKQNILDEFNDFNDHINDN